MVSQKGPLAAKWSQYYTLHPPAEFAEPVVDVSGDVVDVCNELFLLLFIRCKQLFFLSSCCKRERDDELRLPRCFFHLKIGFVLSTLCSLFHATI